jgi:hypothetical protein
LEPSAPIVKADITATCVRHNVDLVNTTKDHYDFRVRAHVELVEIAGVDYRIDSMHFEGRGYQGEYDSTEIGPADIVRQCGSRDVKGGTAWAKTVLWPWDWNLTPWGASGPIEGQFNFDAYRLTVNVTDANGIVIRLADQGPDWYE